MRMSEARNSPGSDTTDIRAEARWHRGLRGVRGIVFFAVLALLLLATARLVAWTISQQVSFDGAMNLEVARSLAEGHGYRRLYADHGGFSHEIQTRAPFILPAAAVFAAFGVGIWQAQVVNLLYALTFAVLVFVAVRRVARPLWGLVAAAAALATPGIEVVGMNGYGELPATTWWLAAMLVLFGGERHNNRGYRRALAAGTLIGIAVVTKTVLLIGLVACLLPYVLLLKAERLPNATIVRALLVLAIGVALPLALHEIWHAIALGGIRPWRHWMRDEIIAVHLQAGTHPALHGVAQIIAKARAHFGILAAAIGQHVVLLAAAMISVVVLMASVFRRVALSPGRALIASLLIFAAIYFAWWLLMTPTQKAWYRRIFNGVVVFEVVGIMLIARAWRLRELLSPPLRSVAVLASAVIAVFYATAWSQSLAASKWPPADAAAHNAGDAKVLASLPADANLYGVAWYSAPRVALYSGRRIEDVMRRTPAQLRADKQAYLVLDNDSDAMSVGADWLRRFNGQRIVDANGFDLYRLDTSAVREPFAGVAVDFAALRDDVDFTQVEYAYVDGFYEREGEGWRWSAPESSILLHHGGEPYFTMDVYALDEHSYATPGALAIDVSIDGCHLGVWRQPPEGGNVELRMPLAPCAVAADKMVNVHLVADHVVEASNNRWLAYIVRTIGFADAAASPP